LDQIHRLANLLGSLPPLQAGGQRVALPKPIRPLWAAELFDLHGVRVHPELGTMELVPDERGDETLGGNRPQRLVQRVDADMLLNMLRDIGSAQNVPELVALADRIEAADTAEARALVIDDINRENPGLISTALRSFDAANKDKVFGT